VHCLQQSQQSKQKRTFYFYVLDYLVKKPSRSNFDYCLVSRLAQKLLEWLGESLSYSRQARRTKQAIAPQVDGVKEVNRYMGWAVHSLHAKFERNLQEENGEEESEKKRLEFLEGMRIFHHDAVKNETYLEKCYDDFDVLRNKGWLTLVSPEYFEFGNKLLTKIRSKCNQQKFRELGNACIKMAKQDVLEDGELLTDFFACDNQTEVSNRIKRDVFRQLVEKTLNARIGRESNQFRVENTGRKGKEQSDMTLRDSLRQTGKVKTGTKRTTGS
jgi:hypothetical protein